MPWEHRAKRGSVGVVGFVGSSQRVWHELWTLKEVGVQHAEVKRKGPPGKKIA